MTQERVDWISIGKELNRIPRTCKQKWADGRDKRSNIATGDGEAVARCDSESEMESSIILDDNASKVTDRAGMEKIPETPSARSRVRWTVAQVYTRMHTLNTLARPNLLKLLW